MLIDGAQPLTPTLSHKGRGSSPTEPMHWGFNVLSTYASQRQPNSGEFFGGDSSGVQPENFSIA
jgi:hypothetical protein